MSDSPSHDEHLPLVRGLGLPQAIALNIANMVGIGPFITIPGFIAAMHGPQALIAWVIAAVLVICDGLVWSELGAALPGSGGTYHFLREIFGKQSTGWGRLLPFLFVWQFLVSGTMEIASGYVGAVPYVDYVVSYCRDEPSRATIEPAESANPDKKPPRTPWFFQNEEGVAAASAALLVTFLLSRRIHVVGWLSLVLCAGTAITVVTVIVAGLTHFNASLLTFPKDAFHVDAAWTRGLGAAMLIAIYDYLGYYNICHLGEEVRDPGRTIPRAVITSVIVVAAVNLSIIAVVPWEQAMKSEQIAALFMETLFGRPIAAGFTVLILWTMLACMFAITLGYSRIPYAAALNGDFFPIFGEVHATKRYPAVSLWTLGGLTAVFCFLPLQLVIEAAVTVRILVQFVAQIIGLHVLRKTRPDVVLPFRMWLYPLPSLLALAGWLFVLGTRAGLLWLVISVLASGVAVFFFFLWRPKSPIEP
jgi:amino acid transporter